MLPLLPLSLIKLEILWIHDVELNTLNGLYQESANFPVKGQIINTLDFVAYTFSVAPFNSAIVQKQPQTARKMSESGSVSMKLVYRH